MSELKKWAEDFFTESPNGTKADFILFVRKKEAEELEEVWIEYTEDQLKKLRYRPDNYLNEEV